MPTLHPSSSSTWKSTAVSDSRTPPPPSTDNNPFASVVFSEKSTARLASIIAPLESAQLESSGEGFWNSVPSSARQVGPSAVLLSEYATAIEGVVANEVGKSRSATISRRIQPVVDFLGIIQPLGPLAGTVFPPATVALGVIFSILSASQKDAAFQQSLLDLLTEKMGRRLPIINKHASLLPDSQQLQDIVVDIYADIIDASLLAHDLFFRGNKKKRNTFGRLMKTHVSGAKEDFSAIEHSFDDHVALFSDVALVEQSQMLSSIIGGVEINTQQLQMMTERDMQSLKDKQDNTRREILRWISDKTLKLSFVDIHEKLCRDRIEGTGKWILSHEAMDAWLAGTEQPELKLLSVSGGYGCGKSTLASQVICHLQERARTDPAMCLAYAYCSTQQDFGPSGNGTTEAGTSRRMSYKSLIGSILHQLYYRLPADQDVDEVVSLYQGDQPLSDRDVEAAILNLVPRLTCPFIVIDGVDEFERLDEDEFARVCHFISLLAKITHAGLNLLVFGRPDYECLESALEGFRSINVNATVNSNDISQFIHSKVKNLRVNIMYKDQIEQRLLARADGVFLWASRAFDFVKGKETPAKMIAAIGDLPQKLFDLYAGTLLRVEKRPLGHTALRALLWVANAARPLSTDELLAALSIEPGMTAMDADSRICVSPEDLYTCCEGLMLLSKDGHIRLFHSSVMDFLQSQPSSELSGVPEYSKHQSRAHEFLAIRCLAYLNLDVFKEGPAQDADSLKQLCIEYPLLDYSASCWGEHVAKVQKELDSDLLEATLGLLHDDMSRGLSFQVALNDFHCIHENTLAAPPFPYHESTPFHIIAWFGLHSLVRELSDARPILYMKDQLGYLCIEYAFLRHNKAVYDLLFTWGSLPISLLELHTSGTGSGWDNPWRMCKGHYSLPHALAALNWSDSLNTLLETGYDPNARESGWNNTPLHTAAAEGSLDTLELLLRHGLDVDIQSGDGFTPLVTAGEWKRAAAMTLLLNHNADIQAKTPQGVTALHYATAFDLDITQDLLKRGASFELDKDNRSPLFGAVLSGHLNIVRAVCQHLKQHPSHNLNEELRRESFSGRNLLTMAVALGHVGMVKALVEEYKMDPTRTDLKDRTLLHIAASANQVEMMRLLKCYNIRVDAVSADLGQTALHEAVTFTSPEAVTEMMKWQPAPNHLIADRKGCIPLHNAADSGCVDMVEALLPLGVEIGDKEDCLPLHYAALGGRLVALRLLLGGKGKLYIDHPNTFGDTPLHMAAQKADTDTVDYLLDPGGADVDAVEECDKTALHLAIENKQMAVASKLVQHKANLRVGDVCGRNALHFAAAYGDEQTVNQLINLGCDFGAQDEDGDTALSIAIGIDRPKIVELLVNAGPECRKMVNEMGFTCAHLAAGTGNMATWELLSPYVDELHLIPDIHGSNSLHEAASAGHENIVGHMLQQAGGDQIIDRKDRRGRTPLMLACYYKHVAVIRTLLRHRACLDTVDDFGRNPVHIAVVLNIPGIAQILVQACANPLSQDNLGLSAVDYARGNILMMDILTDPNQGVYTGLQGSEKTSNASNTLEGFILTSARYFLEDLSTPSESLRLEVPELFRRAILLALSNLQDEWALQIYWNTQVDFQCSICRVDFSGTAMACLDCVFSEMCPECYLDYIQGPGMLDIFYFRRVLEKLELSVHLVCRPFWPLKRLDIERLAGMFASTELPNSRNICSEWVKTKVADYQRVHDQWPTDAEPEPINFPGWSLILVLAELCEDLERDDDDSDAGKGLWDSQALDLRNLSEDFDPRKELSMSTSTCKYHPIVEMPCISELSEDDQVYFDDDGQLSVAFWLKLEQKYGQEQHSPDSSPPHLLTCHSNDDSTDDSNFKIEERFYSALKGIETAAPKPTPNPNTFSNSTEIPNKPDIDKEEAPAFPVGWDDLAVHFTARIRADYASISGMDFSKELPTSGGISIFGTDNNRLEDDEDDEDNDDEKVESNKNESPPDTQAAGLSEDGSGPGVGQCYDISAGMDQEDEKTRDHAAETSVKDMGVVGDKKELVAPEAGLDTLAVGLPMRAWVVAGWVLLGAVGLMLWLRYFGM